jgi:hypothetical protein
LTKSTHRRKFYLAGDRSAPNDEKTKKDLIQIDDGFYWLDDAKEIP